MMPLDESFEGRAAVDIYYQRYLFVFAAIVTILIALAGAGVTLSFVGNGVDHWSAIAPDHDKDWYLDLAGRHVTQIQDQDLFYHDIGSSIENVRKADIVILGSSLASFGFDESTLERLLFNRYGLRVFNMAFVGVASGQFPREIISKYDIHPKMWIINADDGGGHGNFFSKNLNRAFCADVKVISAMEHGRVRAYLDVVQRNVRWRFEEMVKNLPLGSVIRGQADKLIPRFYRNAKTGATDMGEFPHYLVNGNPGVHVARDTDCHTTPEVIAIAEDYVREIGGEVVLTVIPNIYSCPTQAKEIAEAINVELVLPPRDNYSSWDQGGHLDHNGAIQLTEDIVSALEKTNAFKRIRSNH